MKSWKESVIYQIYPRSYQDSNGDGIGDLKGITNRLPYLSELGVDMIWMSPIFASPNADNGYDTADYYAIMDDFGSMDDFDELLEAAHSYGIGILLDVVLNHSSDEHPWFIKSKSNRTNDYRDYYVWRDGDNNEPPNNWPSFFEGPAWTWDETTNQCYLHLFLDKQPDLNWEHKPMRFELYKMLKYWLDKGVDGFRLDVIPFISKDQNFPDSSYEIFGDTMLNVYASGPRMSEFLGEMHDEVWSKYNCFTLGEGVGIRQENVVQYVDENEKALDAIYHFDHFELDSGPGGKFDVVKVDIKRFKDIFFEWDQTLNTVAWPVNYLGNHDLGRMTSRFGSRQYPEKSAMVLLNVLLTLRGSPIIYMGDELGMENKVFHAIEEFDDVMTRNAYETWMAEGGNNNEFIKAANLSSRDHARTPMPWSTADHGGFTDGQPWIPLNPQYQQVNVDDQRRRVDSVFHFTRRAITIRRNEKALLSGSMERLPENSDTIFAYRRIVDDAEIVVLHNMSDLIQNYFDIESKDYLVLLSNYNVEQQSDAILLNPWQTIILKRK